MKIDRSEVSLFDTQRLAQPIFKVLVNRTYWTASMNRAALFDLLKRLDADSIEHQMFRSLDGVSWLPCRWKKKKNDRGAHRR